MHSPKRLKITEVNPHLICVLCGGYYIDATTVIECLHSFCKSCIVKYLEKNKYCPICDVQIHKTTPLLSIRPDKTLQNIVYKLVPSLFKNEMQRRVQFYEKHQESLPALPEQRGEVTENTSILFPDELLIVCLEYQENQASQQMKRYLHCPAALPVSHLIKLIKGKFSLNAKHQVHIFFKDDPLMEHITLMDIAYTYQCRRKTPIHLTYRILELKKKAIRIVNSDPRREVKEDKQPEKEWKEVQLQISENGVMSVRNVESCECSPIPAVEAPPVFSPSSMTSVNHLSYCSSNIPPPVVSQCNPMSHQSAALVHPGISSGSSLESSAETNSVQKSPAVVNFPPVSCVASASLTSPDEVKASMSSSVPATAVMINTTSVSSPSISSTSSAFVSSAPHLLTTAPSFQTIASAAELAPKAGSPLVSTAPSHVSTTLSVTSTTPSHLSAQLSSLSTLPPSTASPLLTSTVLLPMTSVSPPLSVSTSPKAVTSLSTSTVTPAHNPLIPLSSSTPLPVSVTSQAATNTSPSVSMMAIPSPPVSLAGYPSPSLPTSPSLLSPHGLVTGNMPPCSQGVDSCTVTTVAGMKPSTNLVPANYPIMSTCRSQTEPIVSVSKVSKDQVRKPNNVIEVNKLSISRVPPGGIKEKGENLNKIVNKLSPNERVIGNTSVTIRPVTNSPNQSKLYPLTKPQGMQSPPTSVSKEKPQQIRYKSLKTPAKQWNPPIDRTTMLMKQNADQSKPSRLFKIRNMPRFLGNPSSGVKPLYACPEDPMPNSPQNKQKLTLMKADPKTIPTSSIPRSPTKQPPPYTPGSPKMSKPPPSYSDPKTYMNPRMPSPAHAGTFVPPYHFLYSGYPGFSHEANRMISPELIRSMCAYHPSLPPSIGMLFNPMHPMSPRPQDGFKPEPTPAVQRIPPSKTESPSPKPMEDKRFPSPLGISENKKMTPPPASPKESGKSSPAVQEPPPKVSSPAQIEQSTQNSTVDAKDNHSDAKTSKSNSEDSTLVKINCDDINLNNNNNSKESPPSQTSENLANRSQ